MNNANTNDRNKDIIENDIQRLSVLRSFKPLLERLHSHADCFNRKLHYDQYVSLILLYFFNPTFTGLRSLQQVSAIEDVRRKLGIKQTSLGSLSEASNVFDPELLRPIITELASDATSINLEKRLNNLDMSLVAVDGTLLKALPKMLWALWLHNTGTAPVFYLIQER